MAFDLVLNDVKATSFGLVLNDLTAIYQPPSDIALSGGGNLAEEDVRRWAEATGEPPSVLYDRIATYLARGFHSSELPYTFCHAVLNGIFGVISSADEPRPRFFWEVYLAFDEAEYHRNRHNEDPVQLYTRPRIARIVASLDRSES